MSFGRSRTCESFYQLISRDVKPTFESGGGVMTGSKTIFKTQGELCSRPAQRRGVKWSRGMDFRDDIASLTHDSSKPIKVDVRAVSQWGHSIMHRVIQIHSFETVRFMVTE